MPYAHAPRATRRARATHHAPRPRIARHTPRSFRVGIAWQCNPKQDAARQRSVRLRQFAPLARLPGVQLFSLQKGQGSEQLGTLANDFMITDLGSHLNTLMDTAAIMMNLDLVITIDSAMAHCAGRWLYLSGWR